VAYRFWTCDDFAARARRPGSGGGRQRQPKIYGARADGSAAGVEADLLRCASA
jgi:hypothetical protein